MIEGILQELPATTHGAIVAGGPDLRLPKGLHLRRVPGSGARGVRILYQRLLLPLDVAVVGQRFSSVDRVLLLDSYVPLIRPQRRLRYAALVHDTLALTHPHFWPRAPRLVKRSAFASLRSARPVLFTSSEFNAREIQRLLGLPARVVEFGCGQLRDPEADEARAAPLPDQEQYLLAVGAIEPRKDTMSLLAAFEAAVTESLGSDLRLRIVGAGRGSYYDAVRSRAARSRFADRIEFMPSAGRRETLGLIARARAIVFPSLAEGFGLPILEALALGTPVVASEIEAVRSWAGDAVEYGPPGRPGDWLEPISSALETSVERRRGGQAFAQSFRWKDCANRIVDF